MSLVKELSFYNLIEKNIIEIPIIQREYAQGRQIQKILDIRQDFVEDLILHIKENKKLHTYTDIIINQSNKLNNHIEKILNIAKSDYRPLELKKETVLIIPIIEEAIENIHLKYPEAVIKIETHSKEYLLETDIFHFSNIIYNLLDNAVKYCNAKPEITIKISDEKSILKIEVIDNGIGISSKKISFIFDKFYRVQNEKSNEVNGFGLGLYYVKEICGLQNWKIKAENNTTNGVTITLSIPYKK